jgi:hypothetical protein
VTFDEFVAAVDARLAPFNVVRMPEQERDGWAGWKTEYKHAQLHHHPENSHFPVALGFTDIGGEGIATAVWPSSQQPFSLRLAEYDARTAALEILKDFGVDVDADNVA